MSPVAYTWGPFSAKIFLKIWFCKIDPLLPPHIDFNTIPYFTYGCPYRGVKEGKLKTTTKLRNMLQCDKSICHFSYDTSRALYQTVVVDAGTSDLWPSHDASHPDESTKYPAAYNRRCKKET